MTIEPFAGAAAYVERSLAPIVASFRALQDPSGRVTGDRATARALLDDLRAPVREVCGMIGLTEAYADAFEADLDEWIAGGLDAPQFDRTLAAYDPAQNGRATFFIAPLIATNGPAPRGKFLECFLAYREEPPELEQIAERLPHPKNRCQSARLLAGSHGFMDGNCIVFFPENVATRDKVEAQNFALFFFNKFQRIYLGETIPRVRRIFGAGPWVSADLAPADCYRTRCIWGYLHDYFHHCGPRPLDANLQVKMNFFAGLLEEIKVDCQSAVAAATQGIPFGRELVEFILFERMFRYPGQPDATTNFDAGTGVLLFEWLLHHSEGLRQAGEGLALDLDACLAGMERLAARIEEIEATGDNAAYRRAAKQFVYTLLPEGSDGARFSIPEEYARLTHIQPSAGQLLHFADLPY